MKKPLYFHVRKQETSHLDNNRDIYLGRDMTFCVEECEDGFAIGHSLVRENDIFNKKTGRKIAHNRMLAAKFSDPVPNGSFQLHPEIEANLGNIIQRSGEIAGKFGEITVKLLNHFDGRKVPVSWTFKVVEPVK